MAKITSSDALDLITLSKAENKIGDVKTSMLTLAQFSSEHLGVWQLMDGGSCTGTAYQTMTGNTTVPDMRGTAPRMKDYGAGRNPDGDLALGTYQADMFASHSHTYNGNPNTNSNVGKASLTGANNTSTSTNATGGNETRMKNVTLNFFIKVGY